jgi:PBSX family phage terminase large subunit
MANRPLSDTQIEAYVDSNARINIFEGSVRSGKSFIGDLRFLKELKDGPEGAYIICGKSERTVLHNVIEPLQAFTGNIIKYNRGMGEFTLFDRKVYVVGANDERAEGKIRGSTFAGALVDEISILPATFFRMLLSRLSIPNAKLFGTTNPDSPYHWLKTDFIDRQAELDIKVFKFRLEDNPSLTKDYVDNLKKEYKGLWYKRFIEGSWVLAEGAIFDFFDQEYHVWPTKKGQAPTYAKYYILGVDYGTSNPFAAVLIGFNDDHHPTLWVEKEYYWDPKVTGYQKTDLDFANDLNREFGGYPVKMIYLDPAAQSFEVELRRHKKPVKQAKNDVLDGIRFVSNLFTAGDLVIGQGCVNLIKEVESYIWDSKSARDGVDKPIKQRDHAVDALRYALYTEFGAMATLKNLTKEERYRQQEQRKWAQNPMQYPGYTDSYGWQNVNGPTGMF